jgi:hypothetical protein
MPEQQNATDNGVQKSITERFFILNIFIALMYTYTTPVGTGSTSRGLYKDDRPPPAGCEHLGV